MHNTDHQQAQAIASEASLLARTKNWEAARRLYASAAEHELRAIAVLPPNAPRTKGILVVSLASMFYKAQEYDRAEEAIFQYFNDPSLMPPAKVELKRLLEVVWDEKAIATSGKQYSGEELLVSLRGGRIGHGTAPMEAMLHVVGGFNSLLHRVGEWEGKFPFRKRGLPPKSVLESVQARVTQPAFGSYRFCLRLLEPFQMKMFEEHAVIPADIAGALFKVAQLASEGSSEELKELVPDAQYRGALLKLIRNILPSGNANEELELTRISRAGDEQRIERVLLVRGARKCIADAIASESKPAPVETVEVRGVLRALHLDRNWLEIATDDGHHHRFRTPDDVLDDVVGPMVNRRVVVRAYPDSDHPNMPRLTDIELEEKTD